MPDVSGSRVYFALWPEPDVALALDAAGVEAHALAGGRRMLRDTLHMTLAFIGNVQAEQVRRLRAMASHVESRPFEFSLDRLGFWPRRGILWAGCTQQPAPLNGLAVDLALRLRADGFSLEERPFAAHVTLLRNARWSGTVLPELPPLQWRATDFVLVESLPGTGRARYRIIGRWPLR